MSLIRPIKLKCNNLRQERQYINNINVFQSLKDNNITDLYKFCNTKELKRVLDETQTSLILIIEKCKNDDIFTKVLAGRISINASRQGLKDEIFIIEVCNSITSKCGVNLTKLSATAYRPSKNGKIVTNKQYKLMNKFDCLKSFDCKITGKITGWIFAKVVFGNGGHQNNVFVEAYSFCEWVKKYGIKTDLYVVLIDTNLHTHVNDLNKKYKIKNLIIGNHIIFQQYIIDNYSCNK